MRTNDLEIAFLCVTETHLANRVAKGTAANSKALLHDFIQLYRTQARITQLRLERGDSEWLTN